MNKSVILYLKARKLLLLKIWKLLQRLLLVCGDNMVREICLSKYTVLRHCEGREKVERR